MSRTKGLVALLFVAAVVALVLLPRGRKGAEHATRADEIALSGYAEDGALLWEIRAASGRIDDAGQSLNDVSIDFYEEESPALTVHADRLDRNAGISRLSGAVRIDREDDLRLRTEALTWDESASRLDAGPIDLSAEHLHASAPRFAYDLTSKTASLEGGVEATAVLEAEWAVRADRAEERDGAVVLRGGVLAESSEGDAFRCEAMEIEPERRRASLSGDVIGDWASGHLRAETVQLDEDGFRAAGGVVARLFLEETGEANEP